MRYTNQLESRSLSDNFTLDGKSLDDLSVGNIYPIVGMITDILEEGDGSTVLVEVNNSIKLYMNISAKDKINTIKSKAFETAVFVSKVVSKSPTIEAQCQAVFFGKSKKNWV